MHSLNDIIKEIEKYAKKEMVSDILHGWPHVERVLKYALIVNEEMQGNWDIIKSAILLHDIGHKLKRENHNELSAQIAEKLLIEKSIQKSIINNVKKCILTHSRQFAHQKPSSIEAKVVFDADGMDLFGPIGLMRALLSCAQRNKGLECMIKKMEWRLAQKPYFFSKTAKKFVTENVTIIEKYLRDLNNQIQLIESYKV